MAALEGGDGDLGAALPDLNPLHRLGTNGGEEHRRGEPGGRKRRPDLGDDAKRIGPCGEGKNAVVAFGFDDRDHRLQCPEDAGLWVLVVDLRDGSDGGASFGDGDGGSGWRLKLHHVGLRRHALPLGLRRRMLPAILLGQLVDGGQGPNPSTSPIILEGCPRLVLFAGLALRRRRRPIIPQEPRVGFAPVVERGANMQPSIPVIGGDIAEGILDLLA